MSNNSMLCFFNQQEDGTIDLESFGVKANMSIDQVIQKLKESEEQIKKDILTEFKIKEGAEKMRAVSDRKSKIMSGQWLKKQPHVLMNCKSLCKVFVPIFSWPRRVDHCLSQMVRAAGKCLLSYCRIDRIFSSLKFFFFSVSLNLCLSKYELGQNGINFLFPWPTL